MKFTFSNLVCLRGCRSTRAEASALLETYNSSCRLKKIVDSLLRPILRELRAQKRKSEGKSEANKPSTRKGRERKGSEAESKEVEEVPKGGGERKSLKRPRKAEADKPKPKSKAGKGK